MTEKPLVSVELQENTPSKVSRGDKLHSLQSDFQDHNFEEGGRLQRPATNGYTINKFSQVLGRHGLFVLMLAALCLLSPAAVSNLQMTTMGITLNPTPYGIGGLLLSLFFAVYILCSAKVLDTRQALWIIYLLGISIGEEWVFRLALPSLFTQWVGFIPAVILCNLAFALMHFFTLRWRLKWCVSAFIGGLGFSMAMRSGDLMLVIALHWFLTFLNTPYPPNAVKRDSS